MAWQTGTSTDWKDLLDDLVTFADANGWDVERNTTVGDVKEVILNGDGGGSDAIYVGIRTYHDASSGARNWELAGMTGYVSGNTWENQPDISPGRYNGATADERYGAYVPLSNSTISYWFSSTSRRIIVVAKCGTSYASAYLGWINPAGTTAEYPYPLYIAGNAAVFNTVFNSTRISYGGLADPAGYAVGGSEKNGSAFVRTPGGVWVTVKNYYEQAGTHETVGTTRLQSRARVVFPSGCPFQDSTTLPNEADRWYTPGSALRFQDIIPPSGVPGTQGVKLYKTNDSGGDRAPLYPCTVLSVPDANEKVIHGEIDDVAWVSAAPGLTGPVISSEDTVDDGPDTWHVFQSGNKTEDWNYFAIREG